MRKNARSSGANYIYWALFAFSIFLSYAIWQYDYYKISFIIFTLSSVVYLSRGVFSRDGLSYRSVILLPGMLYILTPLYHIAFEGNYMLLNEEVFKHIMWGSGVYVLFMYILLPGEEKIKYSNSETVNTQSVISVKVIFITLSLFYVFYLVSAFNYAGTSRGERISGQQFLSTLIEFGLITNCILLFAKSLKFGNKWPVISAFAALPYIIVEIIQYGDRRTALSLVVALVTIAVVWGKLKVRIHHLIFTACVVPFVAAFGVLRSSPPSLWPELIFSGDAFVNLSPMTSEFGASAFVANMVGSDVGVFAFNPSYYLIPIQLIPEAIMPRSDAFMSPAIKFSAIYFPEVFNMGGAFGYNIILESFANFIIIGPLILAVILCSIFRYSIKSIPYLSMFILGSFSFTTTFIFRSDLIGWFQGYVYILFIGCALSLFSRVFEPNARAV